VDIFYKAKAILDLKKVIEDDYNDVNGLIKIDISNRFQLPENYLFRIKSNVNQISVCTWWFTGFHGRKPNKNERLSKLYFGTCTPLYDDLIDEFNFTEEQIFALMKDEEITIDHPYAFWCRFYFKELMKTIEDKNGFSKYFELNNAAQFEGNYLQSQLNNIDSKALLENTIYKGATAMLLTRNIIEEPLSENEKIWISHSGSLLQIENDIFGAYLDTLAKKKTFVTQAENPLIFENLIDLWLEKTFLALEKAKPKNLKQTWASQSIIFAMGKVCLNQYKKVISTHGKWDVSTISRNEGVCDMEKTSTRIDMLKEANKIYNTFI
jgi:hypothetical protein